VKVLNILGGPGVGKSTVATAVFSELRRRGISAEYVPEVAKDVIYDGRSTVDCQPLMFGQQLWELERLRRLVDVAVTDGPLPLFAAYAGYFELGETWRKFVMERWATFDNYVLHLHRDRSIPFETAGRYQTSETVQEFDELVTKILVGDIYPAGVPGDCASVKYLNVDRLLAEIL